MFVSNADRPSSPVRTVDPAALAALARRVAPISAARTQLLPVAQPLCGLLPERGLRRGTAVGITAGLAGGATTLALALVAAASASGSWCAVVGLPDLGVAAAAQLGVDLGHLVCVPAPGVHWAQVCAQLVEGVDVVVVCPPRHVRASLVRRLMVRVRDRRSVLVVVPATAWPEPCDLDLDVPTARWTGIGPGEDCLRRRRAAVTAGGRRAGGRSQQAQLWLPARSAAVAPAA